MIRIVHIADLHLDSPFSGCTAQERNDRRNELRDALSTVCAFCNEKKTQLLLIAGDLFDGDFVRRETVSFAASCFASIPETRVFIAPGNHDPYNAASPYKYCSFPDNVHIFTSEDPQHIDIPELGTAVYGYAFTSEKMKSDPLAGLRASDTSKINILVGHGDLDFPSSPYYNIKISDLSASGFDYAALGHIHKPSGFMKYGKTVCAYSGCLVGRDFGECGKHGMAAGEISSDNTVMKYIPVTEMTYEEICVDVTGKTVDEAVWEIKEKRMKMPALCRVRAELIGENTQTDVICAGIARALEGEYSLAEVQDHTNRGVTLEDISDEYSLRGAFARKIRPYMESEDPDTAKKAAIAFRYGLDALKK